MDGVVILPPQHHRVLPKATAQAGGALAQRGGDAPLQGGQRRGVVELVGRQDQDRIELLGLEAEAEGLTSDKILDQVLVRTPVPAKV